MLITVVGAGVMGTGIAQALATNGHLVTCCDKSLTQLAAAQDLVRTGRYGVLRGVERGKLTEAAAELTLGRISYTTSLEEAASRAELVIEAVPEDLGLKMNLFRLLDQIAPDSAIIASNTSGLPVVAMANSTTRPQLVIGWHWASPAVVMRMAEIVVTPMTAASTVDAVVRLATDCGKRPVVVHENVQAWGFAGNRVMNAMLREARQVVAEGVVTSDGLDQILVDGWGWPVGPFQMLAGAADGWGDNRDSSIKDTNRM